MLVVVLLLVIIFLGIAAFLFYIEKRLQKAEEEIKRIQDKAQEPEPKVSKPKAPEPGKPTLAK